MDRATLASYIDQTLLKPSAGYRAASVWLEEQVPHPFAALCVSPFLVPLTAQRLAGSVTRVCSVAAFPNGTQCTETKADEARLLVTLGCVEVDMVINVGAVIEGDDAFVVDDVAAVVRSVDEASGGAGLVKVILETGYLDWEQIDRASRLSVAGGARFVKTSTGFGPRGASIDDVRIMRAAVGPDIGVKAAGGIRDLPTALAMIEAGATRLGTSSGAALLDALDAFNAGGGSAADPAAR
jgi:deoxyribose-phosphate aldolase